MDQAFEISFNNMIRDKEFEKLPCYAGIYLFRLSHVENDRLYSKVIYIGKAESSEGLAGRVNEQHEHLDDARKLVKKAGDGYFLTISYTDKNDIFDKNDWLLRIEAALIYSVKPELNTDGVTSFTYDDTIINISGSRYNNLEKSYQVNKTK